MATSKKRAPAPTKSMYQLGLPATFADQDLAQRFRSWHAPRMNRWEYLRLTRGHLAIQRLDMAGISMRELDGDSEFWIGPGVRWRVTGMSADACVELETHVDNSEPANVPRSARAALLDGAEHPALASEDALTQHLGSLGAGGRFILRSGFDPNGSLRVANDHYERKLYWRSLEAEPTRYTTLILRSQFAIGLLEYLTLDHLVSEAALVGARQGDGERLSWLHNALVRHIEIEEAVLFPAYLDVGGNERWVYGLRNDHNLLRNDLEHMAERVAQNRFLTLLDGHDEREEETLYPDLIARCGARIKELTEKSINVALVPEIMTPGRVVRGEAPT